MHLKHSTSAALKRTPFVSQRLTKIIDELEADHAPGYVDVACALLGQGQQEANWVFTRSGNMGRCLGRRRDLSWSETRPRLRTPCRSRAPEYNQYSSGSGLIPVDSAGLDPAVGDVEIVGDGAHTILQLLRRAAVCCDGSDSRVVSSAVVPRNHSTRFDSRDNHSLSLDRVRIQLTRSLAKVVRSHLSHSGRMLAFVGCLFHSYMALDNDCLVRRRPSVNANGNSVVFLHAFVSP